MFLPNEASVEFGFEVYPELQQEAFSKKVCLTNPATLLMALRAIENLWKYEQQNQNVQEIATKAALCTTSLWGLPKRWKRFPAK